MVLFNDITCWQYTWLKVMGYSIIAAAACLKAPQIVKILNTCSVEGITTYGAYAELFSFANTCFFAIHLKLPLSVYGETVLISIQNAFMVLLLWTFSKTVCRVEKVIVFSIASTYIYTLLNDGLQEETWTLIASSTICFSLCARVPQIWLNYKN